MTDLKCLRQTFGRDMPPATADLALTRQYDPGGVQQASEDAADHPVLSRR